MKTFNNHERAFMRSVANFVHYNLDSAEIPHFVHSFPSCCSVVVYLSSPSYHEDACFILMKHPDAKFLSKGIDEDGDAWIQIYF